MGRRRVEIKKIEDKARRQTTFTKRRQGLFKKAEELCKRCGSEAAVITFSNAGNAFAFGSPSVDSVIKRYLSTESSPSSSSILDEKQEKEVRDDDLEVLAELEEQRRRGEIFDRAIRRAGGRPLWEVPVDGLEFHELDELYTTLEEIKNMVVSRANEMESTDEQPSNGSQPYHQFFGNADMFLHEDGYNYRRFL